MQKKQRDNTRPERAISLHPLTPEQALMAALRIKPADLKRMEAGEKKAKKTKKATGAR